MAPRKAQPESSQPAELKVPLHYEDGEAPEPKGKRLSEKEVTALEKELGIKRETAIVDKQRVPYGECLAFDDLMEEDPSGQAAREAFAWVPVTVDLGEQADRITFDRKIYFHGRTYQIRMRQLAGFNEVMFQSQRHDAEVNGKQKGLRNTKKNWGLGRDGVGRAGAGAVK